MADYLDALGSSPKSPTKGGSDYLAALDSLTPKNTKLQSDTQISQLDQPTGTFYQQRKPANVSLDFESPQEAYVNEPARRVERTKEAAGTIGPQKMFPSGKAELPKPPMLPGFIKNILPDAQIDVPESVNTFLGGLKGKASQLPVNDGVTVNDALNHASELYEDVAHKPHLPLGELADQYISSGAPTTGRASLFGDQALRGVAGAVEPFTTTENLALGAAGVPGGPVVQRAASAYFADQALTGIENDIGDVVTGKKSPIEGIASGLVNFGIAKGALSHVASGEAAAPTEKIPVQGSPRLNFLQPMIDNAPREGTNLQNAAQAEEPTGQQQLDQKRAAAKQERMQQPAAMSYLDALDSVAPKESLFKAGDEVPQNATPEQLSAIDKAGFEIGQDGRLAEKAIPPSPRVGEEVPGLDQQAEQIASRSQNEGIRAPNESSPENAPQGDLSLRGEQRENPSENIQPQQGAPIAQESTPLQAEVHPKYDQIGIDADSGQPILKKKEVVPGNSPTPEEIAALKGKHGINDEPRQFVGSPGEKLAGEFRQDPASMLRRYEQIPETQGGKYVATDTAKELSGEYASSKEARRRYDQEVQGPAGDIAKAQYEARLKQITPESDRVILVTGAPGSGKSTIAKGAIDKSVNTVFEGNFTRPEVAFRYIDKAIAAGGKPEFRVVVANPETIAKRLLRRTDEIGRPVTLDYAAQVYKALPETVDRIREKYGNQVAIQIIDNTRDNVAPRRVPVEFLDSLRYTKTVQEIENELRNHAKAFHETGGSSQEAFDAVFGGRDLRQDHRNNAGERQAESGRQVNPEQASQSQDSVAQRDLDFIARKADLGIISPEEAIKAKSLLSSVANVDEALIQASPKYAKATADFRAHLQKEAGDKLAGVSPPKGAGEQSTQPNNEPAGALPAKAEIVKTLRSHPLVKLKVPVERAFAIGSFASGKEAAHSDFDVLLEIPKDYKESPEELQQAYRNKIAKHFMDNDLHGVHDEVHPQWNGRRVDVYFTKDANAETRPKVLLSDSTSRPSSGGRVISEEKYKAAHKSFLDKVTRSSAGVDVSAVKDLAVIGAYHFESGIRTFAEWSKKMVAELGEAVRPHLTKIWNDIQEKVANGEPLPKALAKGSATVAEKPKPLSFLKNPEAQKTGNAPPKVPTFLKTESAPEGKENFAGNINLDKYSVTDAAKQIVKDAAVTHEGFTEQRRGVQSHEQTKALAASLGLTTEELSKTRKGSAFNAEEMHAAGNLLASSAETMRKLQDKAAKTGNVNDQIAVLEAYARHVAVQQAVSGATAEAGRALNALKIIRQAQDIAGKDNRTKVLDALREHLGEDWVNHAEAITKKVSQFPEGDTASLNKFLRETAKQPFAKYVNSFYIANLLSGTKTVLKKAGGDLALGLIQHPQRVAEGLIDASTHKILGRNQEHFVREALPAAQAYVYAMPKAIQKFAYVMKNGFTPEQASALEIPGIVELPGGLKNPLNHATRALSATAEMFKTMALEGELAAEATRQAIKEGATGQALDRRIRQLVTERPPELIERAAKQSKYETYTSDGDGMVKAAQYIQSLFKIPEDFAIKPLRGFEPMRLVIPFAKVPWNIAKIGIEYGTPARALSFLSQEGRSAKNFAPNTAKALIGSSVFAIGYSLAQQGNLTGPIPKDQKEKEAFFGEGKQPYSAKIGDQWVSYHVIPPLALGWAAAAALHDTKGDPAPDRILEIGSAVAKSLTDASFFRGLNNVMEAIQDPGSIGSKVKQLGAGMASGFVPLSSLLRQTAHAKDSTVRDADTIYDRVKANIPILEEELPAKIDRFGRPVTRRGDEGLKAFLPLQPAESQPLSRIDQEVDRLDVKVPDVGKTITIKNKQFELSKDQQRELQKLSGNETFRILGELLSKDQYKQLDDEKKSLIVERAIHAAREKARTEYIQKNFKTLTPKPATPKFFGQPVS